MSTEQTLYGLKGNIIYSKSSKQLEICENGYLICEDGKVRSVSGSAGYILRYTG